MAYGQGRSRLLDGGFDQELAHDAGRLMEVLTMSRLMVKVA